MSDPLFEQITLQEVRETPEPKAPRIGRWLVLPMLAVASGAYLFSLVPPLLFPALDLGALAFLAALALWLTISILRRILR